LNSARVCQTIEHSQPPDPINFDELATLVQVGHENLPLTAGNDLSATHCVIEIPADINSLRAQHPNLAAQWRDATRQAFMTTLNAGFVVVEFHRRTREGLSLGAYLLSKVAADQDFDRAAH